MAWRSNFGSSYDDDEKNLTWDLRRVYAEKVVGVTLQEISMARKLGDFPRWFKLLKRDLFTEISKELEREEKEKIYLLFNEIQKIINENKSTYQKKSNSPESYEKIENALCKLEITLWELMQRHKMFGYKETYDEDEI